MHFTHATDLKSEAIKKQKQKQTAISKGISWKSSNHSEQAPDHSNHELQVTTTPNGFLQEIPNLCQESSYNNHKS